jgi:eukaryotic-like serine/threonine-protein kinase
MTEVADLGLRSALKLGEDFNMAGQVLGERYEVEQSIGRQVGRWTLLTRDLETQERVVIKLLCIDDDLKPDDLRLFERELATLKGLTHPCIPRYLGYFEHALPTGKALALVQTYIAGKSIERCMEVGRTFTESETKQLAKALLGILVYLHGQPAPIVHRDIQPCNIILADRRAHLVDFGSIKMILPNDNTAMTTMETTGYMAPEQLSGRALTGSDLYSLGITLIAGVTGKHPVELPRRRMQIDFEAVVDLSPTFGDWLKRLTLPDLDRRFASAQEALQALPE